MAERSPVPVQPCTNGCGTMTRPQRTTIADHPETKMRRANGVCSSCAKAVTDTEAARARDEKIAEERIAAAHKVRLEMERRRQERQAAAGRKHLAEELRRNGLTPRRVSA